MVSENLPALYMHNRPVAFQTPEKAVFAPCVQIDKWVADMNRLFPNCPYYHITFTVPSQFRTLLFEKKELLNAVFKAATETLLSFCKEQGFLPAITAVLHTFGDDLKRHIHWHCQCRWIKAFRETTPLQKN